LRDRSNNVVEPEDANEVFQPGYWGDILIRPWYQDNSYGKRVNAGLSSGQMVRKDETFGEGRISDEDLDDTFEDYADDDDTVDDEDDTPRRKPSSKKSRATRMNTTTTSKSSKCNFRALYLRASVRQRALGTPAMQGATFLDR
jgi:hypothetical protein